jgi:hypothetical protein
MTEAMVGWREDAANGLSPVIYPPVWVVFSQCNKRRSECGGGRVVLASKTRKKEESGGGLEIDGWAIEGQFTSTSAFRLINSPNGKSTSYEKYFLVRKPIRYLAERPVPGILSATRHQFFIVAWE